MLRLLTPFPPSVCIVSIYRLFTLRSGVISDDPTWDNVSAAIWSMVELSVSIIASTLPTLRPLLARVLPAGLGFASARRDPSAYLRYDSSTLKNPRGTNLNNSTTGGRGTRFKKSISTEELALSEMGSPDGGIATTIYADASWDDSDHARSFTPDQQENERRITKTTKITVNSG